MPRQSNPDRPRQDVAYLPWITVQCTLPHSRQTQGEREAVYYERVNGKARLTMLASPQIGLPYGKVPRLLLAHLVKVYLTEGTREIDLGRSYAAFLAKLGMSRQGGKRGDMTRFQNQAIRLFGTAIQAWDRYEDTPERSAYAWRHQAVATEGRLWWDKNDATEQLFNNYIVLSEGFARSCERTVPVDLDVLKQLRGSFSIDLYSWLTYRAGMSRGREPITIGWKSLSEQFGHGYARPRAFRTAFKRALRPVLDHYPVSVEVDQAGITIYPRTPHVPRRRR